MVDVETNLAEQPKKKCDHCDTLMDPRLFIIPIFGFSTQYEYKPQPVGDSRPSTYYATQTQFWGTEGLTEKQKSEAMEKPIRIKGKEIIVTYSPGGKLFVLNQGINGRGLHICPSCGYAKDPITILRKHEHDNKFKKVCANKKFVKASLGQTFSTDILKITLPAYTVSTETYEGIEKKDQYLSVLYAILEGASKALDISREDISGCITEKQELVLFDDTAGGSGFVKQIYKEFDKVLREARNRVSGICECTPETSCYGCLRNYSNSFFHDRISRGMALDYLDWLLNHEIIVDTKGAATTTKPDNGEESIGVKILEFDAPDTTALPDALSQIEALRDAADDESVKAGYEKLIRAIGNQNCEKPVSVEKLPAKEKDIWPELFWGVSQVALFTPETRKQYEILKKYNWYCYIVDENINAELVVRHIRKED